MCYICISKIETNKTFAAERNKKYLGKMILPHEIIYAYVAAQRANLEIIEFLQHNFLTSLEVHEKLRVECEGYVELTGTMLNDITEISKSVVIADDVRQKLKRLLRDEYKRNQRLIEHVRICQRGLWCKQSMQKPVPACDMDWIYKDNSVLIKQNCEITQLCDHVRNNYNLYLDSSIREICWALDEEDKCNKRIDSDVLSCRNGIESYTRKPNLLTHTVSPPGDDGEQLSDEMRDCLKDMGYFMADYDYNAHFGLNTTNCTDYKSNNVSGASVYFKPHTQQPCKVQLQEMPILDDTLDIFVPDFSTDMYSNLPVVSWNTAVKDNIDVSVLASQKPNILTLNSSSVTVVDIKQPNVVCQPTPDNVTTLATTALIKPQQPLLLASTCLSSKTINSSKTDRVPRDIEFSDLSCTIKTTKMTRLHAPIKKAGVKKRELEYPLVGTDNPRVFENRKVRKQHLGKESSSSIAQDVAEKMAIQRGRLLGMLEVKRARMAQWLNAYSEEMYKKSSAYFTKEQSRKRKAMYTNEYFKRAAKCAKLAPFAIHAEGNTVPKAALSPLKKMKDDDIFKKPTVPVRPRIVLKISRERNSWTSKQESVTERPRIS